MSAGAGARAPDPFDFAQGRLRGEGVALVVVPARTKQGLREDRGGRFRPVEAPRVVGAGQGAVPEWGAPWLAANPGKPRCLSCGSEGQPG